MRVCVDPGSGVPAGSAADLSDTPAGRAHKTEWQHRTPETGDMLNAQDTICSYFKSV